MLVGYLISKCYELFVILLILFDVVLWLKKNQSIKGVCLCYSIPKFIKKQTKDLVNGNIQPTQQWSIQNEPKSTTKL